MNITLPEFVSACFQNFNTLKTFSKLESTSTTYAAGAVLLSTGRLIADPERLKECRSLLKENVSCFSSFRSTASLLSVCAMYTSADPAQKLTRAKQNYTTLRKHFTDSVMLPVAAFMLEDAVTPEQTAALAERAVPLYKRMGKKHPFLTGGEDKVFALVLASSHKSDDALIEETEEIYKLLPTSVDGNARQSISHLYALSDEGVDTKCARLVNFVAALEKAGIKARRDYSFTEIALLAALNPDPIRICSDLSYVSSALAEKKDYQGLFGIDTKTRTLHAAMILAAWYAGSNPGTGFVPVANAAASVVAVSAALSAEESSSAAATVSTIC